MQHIERAPGRSMCQVHVLPQNSAVMHFSTVAGSPKLAALPTTFYGLSSSNQFEAITGDKDIYCGITFVRHRLYWRMHFMVMVPVQKMLWFEEYFFLYFYFHG